MLWFCFISACVHPGPVSLTPLDGNDPSVVADVQVVHLPGQGWQLEATLLLRNPSDSQRQRFDLSRAAIRSDGGRWENCHHSAETNAHHLIVALAPGDERERVLRCADIIPPQHRLELRMGVTNAEGGNGVVILEYAKVDQ